MRVLHTVRHLRPRQIAAQISYRLRRSWDDPAGVLRWEPPAFAGIAWQPSGRFLSPMIGSNSPQRIRAGQLEFLNQLVAIGFPPDWNRADLPRLWRYNLQYFEHLWAIERANDAKALVLDWINRRQPSRQHVGWEPYPISLRLMSWCGVLFDRFRGEIAHDPELMSRLWPSIYRQAEWLAGHLETHLQANHLLENAAALTVVGCCFAGQAAQRWRQIGTRLLREQVPEQILPDGGHYERSPMYHCRVVYVLAMLRNIGQADVSEIVSRPLERAVRAMKLMCHPDRQIALLNDSAFGVYNEPSELAAYCGQPEDPPFGSFSLPDTGYFGARARNGSYVICDAASIGPDHQPGHAHGDMLSFELSLRGQRVIVDSGVHDYEPGEMRAYCRSTRAHNTIEINGQDQCEFWDVFRVARRGHVHDLSMRPREDGFELCAWHDGYTRLGGVPRHRRQFRWFECGRLEVSDTILADAQIRAVSRLHLHPDCRIIEAGSDGVRVVYPGGVFRVVPSPAQCQIGIEDSWYCPRFGVKLANRAIALRARGRDRIAMGFTIADGEA
ncbi:heparinase II/III family protein [Fontivita pretiosa]|uniref:heparinase II/III family protein n=1 Tax=Fontivita pretiosa TaxID=2989684 RepID=UPI003D168C59